MNFSPITHGGSITYLRTPGFAVTEATYPAGYSIPQHNHETASLTFVLNGSVAEAVQGRSETLGPRELLLKPAATAHSKSFGHKGARLPLRIVDLAAAEGVHPTRLSRLFRRRYGCAIGDYLRQLRLEKAMQALATTNLPISAIALRAGFADQSHLTRELRKATGLTPRMYREQTRQ